MTHLIANVGFCDNADVVACRVLRVHHITVLLLVCLACTTRRVDVDNEENCDAPIIKLRCTHLFHYSTVNLYAFIFFCNVGIDVSNLVY